MAGDFPGTEFTYTPLTDDPGGDPYEAAQLNKAYAELLALVQHFGAGLDIVAKGGLRLKIIGQGGSTTVGYVGEVAVAALAGTPKTLIEGGTYDVTVGAVVAYMVEPSSGDASGGIITIYNGATETIYEDDGTNEVTLTVAAAGQMTTVRSAGSLTYNIIFNVLCWI